MLIRIHGCAGWSAPLLFTYSIRQVFSWWGSYLKVLTDADVMANSVDPDQTAPCFAQTCLSQNWIFSMYLTIIVGIKHDFLPRGPADVNDQKNMFDHYYCIKKNFIAWKLWRKCFEKFFFPVPIMARKGTLPVNVLKTPLPGQRLMSSWRHQISFATVHVTDDISFCDSLGMLIHKTAKPCINSRWIAWWLKHGC